MKVIGFHSAKETDAEVVRSVIDGARLAGEKAKVYTAEDYPDDIDCDAVVIFGIKGREKFNAYRKAGVQTIYVDKGYDRRVKIVEHGRKKKLVFWRVAVNAHHPTDLLETMRAPADRWESLQTPILPWREEGGHIVLAGSSGKFHKFRAIEDPTTYANKIASEIARRSNRQILYRPKPSWKDAVPVPGTIFDDIERSIESALKGAHALVTYGSNSCYEAVLAGIPCIVLGDAVARPISSTSLDDIEKPRQAPRSARLQWLRNIAYCQWTTDEFKSGAAWPHVRNQLC